MEQYESPVNAIPPAAIAMALLIIGVEIVFSAAGAGFVGGAEGIGWRLSALQEYAYSPLVWDAIVERNEYSFDLLKRFVTYAFVNSSFLSSIFAAALTLALGKFVGEIFGNVPMLIVFFVSIIFGALVFGIVLDGLRPLYGSFVPVYGLIGAYTYVIFVRLGSLGANQLQAFRLIGILLAIQLVFGLVFGGDQIWIAELAGFIAGFFASVLAAPGGWTAFVKRMRRPR